MTVHMRRAVIVVLAAVLGAWMLSRTVPTEIGTVAEPTSPGAGTTPSVPVGPAPDATNVRVRDRGLGVQLSAHHGVKAAPALAVMDRLQQAGAGWVRVDVGWSALQPDGPGPFAEWYADLLDDVIAGARERDLRVIVNLWLTPTWASESGSLYAPPSDVSDYADAIAKAARRWGAQVAAWEVWNEPNFTTFFEGADPATYTRLLCAAYRAVKGYDHSPVVFGGLMYNDDKWLADAYRAGAKGCFDALATHPYVGPSDAAPDTPSVGAIWRLTHMPAMRDVMDEWGDTGEADLDHRARLVLRSRQPGQHVGPAGEPAGAGSLPP